MSTKTVESRSRRNVSTESRVFREIRLLRREISLLLPSERLEEYAHPETIKSAFAQAKRLHPPA